MKTLIILGSCATALEKIIKEEQR